MSFDFDADPFDALHAVADQFADPDGYTGPYPDERELRTDMHPAAWAELTQAHQRCLYTAELLRARRDSDLSSGDPVLAATADPSYQAALLTIEKLWDEAVSTYRDAYDHLDLIPADS